MSKYYDRLLKDIDKYYYDNNDFMYNNLLSIKTKANKLEKILKKDLDNDDFLALLLKVQSNIRSNEYHNKKVRKKVLELEEYLDEYFEDEDINSYEIINNNKINNYDINNLDYELAKSGYVQKNTSIVSVSGKIFASILFVFSLVFLIINLVLINYSLVIFTVVSLILSIIIYILAEITEILHDIRKNTINNLQK